MDYLNLALASASFFALAIILVKYISKYIIKDVGSLFFWTYLTTLPFVGFIPFKYGLEFDWAFIWPMLIHAILLTAGQYTFTKGIRAVDASVIGPLFQLQSGFIVILASLFLQEKYPFLIYGYLFLISLGAMLVSVTDQTHFRGFLQKGVLLICATQLLHAGANIAVGFAMKHGDVWQVLFYSFFFSAVISSLVTVLNKTPVTTKFSKVRWMFLRSLFVVIGSVCLYTAFESNLAISASFGLLSSPLVFVISLLSAWFFPGLLEKQSLKTYLIRSLGMVVIGFGALSVLWLK